MELFKCKHPWYEKMQLEWDKYRLTYEGGKAFIDRYLRQLSKREDTTEFATRQELTYCPEFAAAALNDIKNALFLRFNEITRKDGHKTYQDGVNGLGGGIDLEGRSMNNFIGQKLLPELLSMGRVGVYVDMPPIDEGETLYTTVGKVPYLYLFQAEQIPTWDMEYCNGEMIYRKLVLKETITTKDPKYGVITGTEERLRFYTLVPEGVKVQFYRDGKTEEDSLISETLIKGMKRIPFVLCELSHSLLKAVCNYQIALLNMESVDLMYCILSNFPFYVEPYDPRSDSPWLKQQGGGSEFVPGDTVNTAGVQEVVIGPQKGRKYPLGGSPPDFIHPSSEPLKASMDKEAQIKKDIRGLVNLALASLEPVHASAESKSMDDRSLEAGLSYIGLELERMEREVAKCWSAYMQTTSVATIKYPKKYSLKTDKERREEAQEYSELSQQIPSKTYKREIFKKISFILLEGTIPDKVIETINSEIDLAKYLTSDPEGIAKDLEGGLVTQETASDARGYDGAVEVPKAKKEHAERLAEIAKHQSAGGLQNPAARGVKDGSADAKEDAKDEKTASQDPNLGGAK